MVGVRLANMTKTVLLLATIPLAACATTPPPFDDNGAPNTPELGGGCEAQSAQGLLGNRATSATGAELLALTGASTLRWVPPRTAVTMDYRSDRLTVSYDDDMIIERIACG